MIIISLALMGWMIFTLVKNAIIGVQLGPKDEYHESLEIILPITGTDYFYAEEWIKRIKTFHLFKQNNLRIHFLMDKHNPQTHILQGLEKDISFIEVHTFTILPENIQIVPWMISQISDQIKGKNVIVGDAEIIPTEEGLRSMAYNCDKHERPLLVLPQMARTHFAGEALESLSPSLALISFLTLSRRAKAYFYPLLEISNCWIIMKLEVFKDISWEKQNLPQWKHCVTHSWETKNIPLKLAFGEKHLTKYYPTPFKEHVNKLFKSTEALWELKNKNGLFLFLIFQFLWFIPIGFLGVYPLWTILGLFLLVLYRFFTKIIFQESWISVALHPISNFLHLVALLRPVLKKFVGEKKVIP
jgi:hypothetical protein